MFISLLIRCGRHNSRKFGLKDLEQDTVRMAFDGACKKFDTVKSKDKLLCNLKPCLITEEYYSQALKFARDKFIPHEPLCRYLGITWTTEMEELWLKTYRNNLSVMFVDGMNDEIIASLAIRIAKKDVNSEVDLSSIKSEPLKTSLQFSIYCDKMADFFGHFNTQEAFQLLSLVVADGYKRSGVATHICKLAMDMLQNLGIDPVYIKTESSSKFSIPISEATGAEELYEQPYDTWEVDGQFPIHSDGIHKSIKMFGLRLSSNPKY